MQRLVLLAVLLGPTVAAADPVAIRCDDVATADLAIDGLLDDWGKKVVIRTGTAPDGAVALRCAWDGGALALALDIEDDRIVRVPHPSARASEDEVHIKVSAGGKPVAVDVAPGNAIAKPRIARPAKVAAADSLQPKGFSVEARIPAAAIPGLSQSTPSLALAIVFHDSDQATGGDDADVHLDATIELGDRKDLLDDFLATTHLKRGDLRLDTLAELDPDRRGKERIVAGGTVIGILTDQYAFVTVPGTVKKLELLPLGPHGQQVISALVGQTGNGGTRDLLMLWTVWSGQLQPLAQIEVRKQLGSNILEAGWHIVTGKKPELWVEPRPAVGWTAETWNEVSAEDADTIVVPWDATRSGVAYTLDGHEVRRRDLPKPKHR